MRLIVVKGLIIGAILIGFGNFINDASAKLGFDEKALELIKKSQAAIGGNSAIESVKSMTITGEISQLRTTKGEKKAGEMEINFILPDKFSKTVKIGESGEGADSRKIKRIETVVVSGSGGNEFEFESNDGDSKDGTNEEIIIKKKGNKDEATWTSEDGKTIVIENDGKFEGEDKDGKKTKVFVHKMGYGDSEKRTTEDEKEITIDKIGKGDKADFPRQNEFLKTALALLMTAPEGTDVNYNYIGRGNVDGDASNIIEVESYGARFKLFLNASTNLPQMITYVAMDFADGVIVREERRNMSKEKIIDLKNKMGEGNKVEHQIRFSNFRKVGGLNLPHRWVETIDGKPEQTIDIKSFAFNPSNIAEKFSSQKVFIRKMKPEKSN